MIGVAVLFRGMLPERTRMLFREPGSHPQLLAFPGEKPALYVKHDKWASYLAPESVCPGGEDAAPPTLSRKRRCCASSTTHVAKGA